MIYKILINTLLFIDASICVYIVYDILVLLYTLCISRDYVYIYTKKCINTYIDMLANTLKTDIKTLNNMGNLDKICNFNNIVSMNDNWINDKKIHLYNTALTHKFFIYEQCHNITQYINNASKLIISIINKKLKEDNHNIRLIYYINNNKRYFNICKLHKYMLNNNNDILLYELEKNTQYNGNQTELYIEYDANLYRFVDLLMFDMIELNEVYTDIFDIYNKYIKIVLDNDNIHIKKHDIKVLLSAYYNNSINNDLSDNDLSDNDLSDNDLRDNDLRDNDLRDNDSSDNCMSDNCMSDNDMCDNDMCDNDSSDNCMSDNDMCDNDF